MTLQQAIIECSDLMHTLRRYAMEPEFRNQTILGEKYNTKINPVVVLEKQADALQILLAIARNDLP